MYQIARTRWSLTEPLPSDVKDQDVEIITPGFEEFLQKVAHNILDGINAQFTDSKGE